MSAATRLAVMDDTPVARAMRAQSLGAAGHARQFRRTARPASAARAELRRLGAALERRRAGLPARDRLGDLVEIAGADLALVLGGRVAVLLGAELGLLQLGVG